MEPRIHFQVKLFSPKNKNKYDCSFGAEIHSPVFKLMGWRVAIFLNTNNLAKY